MSATQNSALICLANALAAFELPANAEGLLHAYAIDGDELDTALVLRIAQENGLEAKATRLTWRKLQKLGEALPAMARLRNGRSVLVLGCIDAEPPGAARVEVFDPLADGDGRLRLTRAAFEQAWAGEVVLLRKASSQEAAAEPFGLRWFLPELTRQGSLMRDVALAAVTLQVLALASPVFFQLVVDKVLMHESRATLAVLLVGVGLAILAEGIFRFLRDFVLLFATNRIDVRLARKTFAKLMSLPLGFFERQAAGVLTQHMQQTDQIREFLTGRLFFTLLDGTALLVFVPLMWLYSPKLTLVTLGFAGLIGITILALLGPFRRRLRTLYNAEGSRQALLVETIHGMRTVKSLALEPLQRRAWEDRSARTVRGRFAVGRIAAAAEALVQVVETGMTVAIVAIGAFDVFAGTLTVGALVALQMMAGRVIQPLVQFVSLLKDYQETAISVRMLGKVMNAESEAGHRVGGLRPEIDGRVQLERVTFRYPDRPTPALIDLDLDIRPGSFVGVMGRSGSGKTTLTRLIQGLYAPEQGTIRLAGHDLRDFDLTHLRRNIGVVLQENVLFRGTIRDNIAAARPGATLEEVVRAAQLAGADEFIERMPNGYATPIEENGANLSGGQKQRIAIARALVPEPRILIFDEATSSLDPESELIVQRNLAAIAGGRTMIVVSHRLSTIVDADTILVLDAGRLISAGNHQELLRACPLYRGLWQQQTRFAA